MQESSLIDHFVYPDREEDAAQKSRFEEDDDRADYVDRIYAAWDFDISPNPGTFVLFANWKHIFDQFPIPTSPGYHTFRSRFGWEQVEIVENPFVYLRYLVMDRAEGRGPNPCEHRISPSRQ